MRDIITVLLIIFTTSSIAICQEKYIPKEVKNHTSKDTIISLIFPKKYKVEEFRNWCEKNDYFILNEKIEKIPKFGVLIDIVKQASIIDKELKKYLDDLEIFRKEAIVNCKYYSGSPPPILPDPGKCYICYYKKIIQVPKKSRNTYNHWLDDDTSIELTTNRFNSVISGSFRKGVLQGEAEIHFDGVNSDVLQVHFGMFKDGKKNGTYRVISNYLLGYMVAEYSNGKLTENFKVYPYNHQAWGAYPAFTRDGELALIVESDSRWGNIWKSAKPVVACLAASNASSSAEAAEMKTFISESVLYAFNRRPPSSKDILISYGLEEYKNNLRINGKSTLGVDGVSFILCLLNQ